MLRVRVQEAANGWRIWASEAGFNPASDENPKLAARVNSLAGLRGTRLKSGPGFGSLHSVLVREHQDANRGLLSELPGEAAGSA